MVAISMMWSLSVSSPVISRSIQMRFLSLIMGHRCARKEWRPIVAKAIMPHPHTTGLSRPHGHTQRMSKRKLSDQQKRRISSAHEQRAARADSGDGTADDANLGPEQSGLVLAHFGRKAEIEAQDGAIVRCHLRANIPPLVAGDRVVWRTANSGDGNASGVVVACLPRATVLARPDSHSGTDRKSTRLNSSHVKISYAVFCLK